VPSSPRLACRLRKYRRHAQKAPHERATLDECAPLQDDLDCIGRTSRTTVVAIMIATMVVGEHVRSFSALSKFSCSGWLSRSRRC
jgi:hypothetical protein